MNAVTFNEKFWFAVAEPSRRKLIDILLTKGESSASKLAENVPFSRQAVSKHMTVLKHAGLVRQEHAGKEVRFSVNPEGVVAATQELSKAAAIWNDRLQKIKQIAEATDQNKSGKF